MIESILLVFIADFLISAISARSAFEREPIFFLFGSADPCFCWSFHKRRWDVKGVPISNSYDLSEYTVMIAGTFTSAGAYLVMISLVLSLNSLMKAPILTPFCQRIGPTGGAGWAFPAVTWSVNCFAIFFAGAILNSCVIIKVIHIWYSPHIRSTWTDYYDYFHVKTLLICLLCFLYSPVTSWINHKSLPIRTK